MDAEASLTRSVDRACDVLFALGVEPGETGVTAIARRVGLGKSTVYRLLQSLIVRGLVAYNPATQAYRLGPRLFTIGLQLQARLAIRAEAAPFLHQLRDLTGETATLCLAIGDQGVAVDQAITHEEPKRIASLGQPFPLHVGAVGKALLAFQDDGAIDDYLEQYGGEGGVARPVSVRVRRLGPAVRAIPDAATMRVALAAIRVERYAMSVGEVVPRSNGLAFPILNARDALLGAISITGPSDRWTRARMQRQLPECRSVVDQLALRVRYLEPLALS